MAAIPTHSIASSVAIPKLADSIMIVARPYRRQWIITSSRVIAPSLHFKSLPLATGLYLHHDQDLQVAVDTINKSVTLGHVIREPGSQENSHYSTGRFVLIASPWLSLDAMGLLGVYYFEGQHEVVCSSSVALIAEVTGLSPETFPLYWKKGFNWDLMPTGRIAGLKKLYCDQALNLQDRAIEQRPRSVRTDLSEAAACNALSTYFAQLMVNLGARYQRIYLALTGGLDSRMLMSSLLASGVNFEAFTWSFDAHSERDAELAKQICKRYGIVHREIVAEGSNPSALENYRRHTAECVDDADAHHLVPGNFYRIFQPGDLILLGDGFEISADPYALSTCALSTASSIAVVFGEENSPRVKAALDAWITYRGSQRISNMEISDTFYLDQRLSGWQASICQGQDCLIPEFIAPANSWTCIDLLMANSAERRVSRVIQRRAMDELVPGISQLQTTQRIRAPAPRLQTTNRSQE
ncbi:MULTISPECIES: asparagine synthase-related protein [unclassified Bradyrhizobium]